MEVDRQDIPVRITVMETRCLVRTDHAAHFPPLRHPSALEAGSVLAVVRAAIAAAQGTST